MTTAPKLDLKAVQAVAERPFYATVGVTDLAVEAIREYVAELQDRVRGVREDVSKTVSSIDLQPEALRKDAQAGRAAFEKRVAGLQDEARTVPARVQSLLDENVSALEDAFDDLVTRGESLVGRIRRQQSTQDTVKAAETTVTKAKTTRTQASKASKTTAKKATSTAKKKSAAPRSSAKATATSAKKTASSAAKAASDAASKVGD